MVLREGNMDITGIPPVPVANGIDVSTKIDEKLGPGMI
jgi:hypothetical protein